MYILQKHNASAVERLLAATEKTKSAFLDREFFRQKKLEGSTSSVRLWYVDLDTWMESTTNVTRESGDKKVNVERKTSDRALMELEGKSMPVERVSVPADDEQTHCALSGERFEEFWDEQLQEWRYDGVVKLDATKAEQYGLEEGALVLLSALGNGKTTTAIAAPKVEQKTEEEKEEIKEDKREGSCDRPSAPPVRSDLPGNDDEMDENELPSAKRIKLEAS